MDRFSKENALDIVDYRSISPDKLQPAKDHAFKAYKGEKMSRMIRSVKVNGIIQPPIVRTIENSDEFEIVSGHNRVEAAKAAGLDEIPVVVFTLTDDEAVMRANEANISQRTFKEWKHSEKAKSIRQYHEVVKRQGNRSDLNANTSGGNRQKSEESEARCITACAYGESEYTIRLYLELSRLNESLIERLDSSEFGITSAQTLSFISEAGQKLINAILDENAVLYKVTVENSKALKMELRDYAENNLSCEEKEELIVRIRDVLTINPEPEPESAFKQFEKIVMQKSKYDQLFAQMKPDEIIEEIITAVENMRKCIADRNAEMANASITVNNLSKVNSEIAEVVEGNINSIRRVTAATENDEVQDGKSISAETISRSAVNTDNGRRRDYE